MKNTNNNPQELPQVKSVEEKMTDIIRRIPVNQANFDYISKSQHGINGSLAQDIKSAMKEYAKPLAARIAELETELKSVQPFVESLEMKVIRLEAENDKLREASQKLAGFVTHLRHEVDYLPETYYEWMNKIINETDELLADDEALNSKEG